MLLTGHSHSDAIRDGAALLGLHLPCIRLLNEERGGGRRTDVPERWEQLATAIAASKPDRLLCAIGGGGPVRIGAAQHSVPFDFVLPWLPAMPPDSEAALVPYDAMRALMEQSVTKHLRALRRLLSFGIPLVQLETPPPVRDNDTLAALLKDVTDSPIALSKPNLRYKVWSLHSRVFRDFCAANAIAYIGNPEEALDAHGFLKPGLAGDFAHGNADYGAIVLRHLPGLDRAGAPASAGGVRARRATNVQA